MKKHLFISLAGIGMISVMAPLVAYAADIAVPAARQDMREKREEFKNHLKERVGAIRGARSDMRMQPETQDRADAMKAFADSIRDKREALTREIKKKHDEFDAGAEDRRALLKKKIGEKKAVRVEQFFANMTKKFEDAMVRLESVADRIDVRISMFPMDASQVSSAREKLADARGKISEARAALDSARAQYAEAVKNANIKKAFIKVRGAVESVTGKIKEARAALTSVIMSLRPDVESTAVASTSLATTTSPEK